MRVDRFLLGGDYGTPSPAPHETLARLRELPAATWIRGNGERWLREPPEIPEVIQVYEEFEGVLTDEEIDRLYGLPVSVELDGILYVHGSPISDVESFAPQPEEGEERMLGGVRDRTIVFGHSHQQFRRPGPDGTDLVNPGSVGMPLDGRGVRRARREPDPERLRLGERRVDCHLDVFAEGLRDRAIVLRLLGRLAEAVLVEPVHLATDLEAHRRHPEAVADLVEGRRCLAFEAPRRRPCLRKPVCERHRDARGVRGGDELLGARVLVGCLGTRAPLDGRVAHDAALRGDRSGAARQIPLPLSVCGALNRHPRPPSPGLTRTADSNCGPSARRAGCRPRSPSGPRGDRRNPCLARASSRRSSAYP